MADGTKIEWTDATWNVVNGCSVLSPGCTNCYAMKQAHRVDCRRGLTKHTNGGMVWTGEVRFNDKVLLDPLRWKRPRRIFVCAHGDLFHENVPDEWIDKVFAVMALAPQHTFQVLTKRPERMRRYLQHQRPEAWVIEAIYTIDGYAESDQSVAAAGFPLPNVWLGTSVEDQKRADERIHHLLSTPAAVRWLSCEPLLGALDLQHLQPGDPPTEINALAGTHGVLRPHGGTCEKIDWIVVGGESGPDARPMHPDWARSLRDQCAAAGVPFLFKQWGHWHPSDQHWPCTAKRPMMAFRDDGSQEWRPIEASHWPHNDGWQGMCPLGKKAAGRLLDGVEHNGYPERNSN